MKYWSFLLTCEPWLVTDCRTDGYRLDHTIGWGSGWILVGMSRIADVTIKLSVRPMYVYSEVSRQWIPPCHAWTKKKHWCIIDESCEWKKASTTPTFIVPLFCFWNSNFWNTPEMIGHLLCQLNIWLRAKDRGSRDERPSPLLVLPFVCF